MKATILAAVLFFVATGVSAQTIYREVDDDGHITFSDQPAAKPATLPRRNARQVEANEAARRLKQAQLEREQGANPRPGELNPGAGARTVNYRYWRRQEKLRRLVEQAQLRLNATHRPQLAVLAKSQM